MLKRAVKNLPSTQLVLSNSITYESKFNHIISWGVLHYLPNTEFAMSVVDKMCKLSPSVLLMELPDKDRRDARLAKRQEFGKLINPEPLYFDKQLFVDRGFKVFDTELRVSDNSDFSFYAIKTL
jgi:hypothetical protein